MRGGTPPEELAQSGPLGGGTKTADLRNVDADEINQPLFDERHVFVLCVEQFAHGYGRARLLAQQAKIVVVFWREWVFQKKQAIRLKSLAQIDHLIQGHALVYVLEEFHVVAKFVTHVFK